LFYTIRSCDLVRHYRDDVYMAVRLAQWILMELDKKDEDWKLIVPGNLHFHAYSLHYHRGDAHYVEAQG
jgi:hypothetical protein